jgi:hypothetical protein
MVAAGGRRQGQQPVALVVGAGLGMATLCSVALALVQPLPSAHQYWLSVQLCAWLAAIWALWLLRPDLILRPAVLAGVFVVGLAVGVGGLLTIDRQSEMVHVYSSAFAAIDEGDNPYATASVYHRDGNGAVVLATFNYPPLELVPAFVAYRLAGHWDAGVLTAMVVVVNLLAGSALVVAFRHHLLWVVPWLPLVVLLDVKSNISMTLLSTVLLVWALKAGGDHPGPGHRVLVAVLFGVALTTKFFAIPLFAAYLWHQGGRRSAGRLGRAGVDLVVAGATALAVVAPFGPVAVAQSTIGFNLGLGAREQAATFYPNALSGFCAWLGIAGLYGVLAVAVLGVAVLVAPRVDLGLAMAFTATVFLLVAPTPEPQYVPVLLCLVLALTWWRREDHEVSDAVAAAGPAPSEGVRQPEDTPLVDRTAWR